MISGQEGDLSPHLRSRAEVGEILLDSGVPTAALQAAVIIGSGSASFEMLRYMTERLPAMVTPRWVPTRIQPIAVRDVLRYLVGAATFRGREPAVRHRRPGRADLCRHDAAVRRGGRTAAPAAGVGAGADPVAVRPLGRAGDAGAQRPRPATGGSARVEVVAKEHDIAQYIPDPPEGLLPLDRASSWP